MGFSWRKPKEFKAIYQREIAEKAQNRATLFVIIAFMTFILFIVFGVRPLIVAASENRKVLTELQDIERRLDQKIQAIVQNSTAINNHSDQIEVLYEKLPEKLFLEDYLEEFVLSAAKAGFVVQRFRLQGGSVDERTPIEVELTGNIEALPRLVGIIESGKRFSSIAQVATKIADDTTEVKFSIYLYSL